MDLRLESKNDAPETGENRCGQTKNRPAKSVVDLTVKEIKCVQRTKPQLQYILAKIPEGDSRSSEREVVSFDHQAPATANKPLASRRGRKGRGGFKPKLN